MLIDDTFAFIEKDDKKSFMIYVLDKFTTVGITHVLHE